MTHRNLAILVLLIAQGLPSLAFGGGAESAVTETTSVPFNIGLVPYVDVDSHVKRPKNNVSISGAVGSAWGLEGVSIAGAADFVQGDARGVQVAGATTIARSVQGVQISGAANVAREVDGVQISVVNVGGHVRGAQIGVVNVADEIDGAPIGIVNVVRKSARHDIELATSNTAAFSVGAKLGTRYVYSILGLGLQSGAAGAVYWMPTVGVGGSVPVCKRGFVNIEGLFSAVNKGDEFDTKTFLAQLRVAGGYRITDGVAVFAGPTLGVFRSASGKRLSDITYIPAVATYTDRTQPVDVGIGFSAGVQLL